MTRRAEPPEPGAHAIPAEEVLGREEPATAGADGSTLTPAPTEHHPSGRGAPAAATPSKLTKRDRLLFAGLVAVVAVGGALYLFRQEIATQYEARVHPVRYWANEVKRLQLSAGLAQLDHQECSVELLAARMKQSIHVARLELAGIDSSAARSLASADTEAKKGVCDVLAALLKTSREQLASAEQEFEVAEENHKIAIGVIPRQSPSFESAWRNASPSWAEIEAAPEYQRLDSAAREKVRLALWRDIVSPHIPTEELRRARRQFDELTAAKQTR